MGNSLDQYRLVVGMHCVYLALREYRGCFMGKFWCSMLLLFYFATIYLPVLKRVIRYFELTKMNRLWLTQIFLYRFHISCKSELRRTDRRAAKCVENIFFKTKKLQMKILLGKSQIALRKHKTGSNRITAGQLHLRNSCMQLKGTDYYAQFEDHLPTLKRQRKICLQ